MIRCHKPIPPYRSHDVWVIGFTDYKWYCPHNPQKYKILKKLLNNFLKIGVPLIVVIGIIYQFF